MVLAIRLFQRSMQPIDPAQQSLLAPSDRTTIRRARRHSLFRRFQIQLSQRSTVDDEIFGRSVLQRASERFFLREKVAPVDGCVGLASPMFGLLGCSRGAGIV